LNIVCETQVIPCTISEEDWLGLLRTRDGVALPTVATGSVELANQGGMNLNLTLNVASHYDVPALNIEGIR
jgi:hypothetical protein